MRCRLPHDLLIAFDASLPGDVALTAMSLVDRPRPSWRWCERRSSGISSPSSGCRATSFRPPPASRSAICWRRPPKRRCINWALAMRRQSRDDALQHRSAQRRAKCPTRRRSTRGSRGWCAAGRAAVEAAAGRGDRARPRRRGSRCASPRPSRRPIASDYSPAEAARDIVRLHALPDDRRGARRSAMRASIAERRGAGCKIYRLGGAACPLSDAVPMLENFGFRVLRGLPTALDDGATRLDPRIPVDVTRGPADA